MLAECPMPPEAPAGWMVLQDDQHRRSTSIVPGVCDIFDWLTPLRVRARRCRSLPRRCPVKIETILVEEAWIMEKTAVAPPPPLKVLISSLLLAGRFP